MKLSEAILLGSTVVTPKAGQVDFSRSFAGCALGMAAAAKGCIFIPASRPIAAKDRRTLNSEDVWGHWLLRYVMRPCTCWDFQVPREMRIKDVIAHLFDYHVVERKTWTLDQLVAWVEKWEPQDSGASRYLTPEQAEEISRGDAALQMHVKRRREDADESEVTEK